MQISDPARADTAVVSRAAIATETTEFGEGRPRLDTEADRLSFWLHLLFYVVAIARVRDAAQFGAILGNNEGLQEPCSNCSVEIITVLNEKIG